jgi:hypothetical protein
MADPVSSVAYAIEGALRALPGHLGLLPSTIGIVIGIIALVTLNSWQLVRAFPEGAGSPEAADRAFGEEWSFLPIGALVVEFALTITISLAAARERDHRLPAWAGARTHPDLALGAHGRGRGAHLVRSWRRMIFAAMTSSVIIATLAALALGWISPHATHCQAPITVRRAPALIAVVLAFPVAMALATGTEAPATSIAQLGQLDTDGRPRFGRGTLACCPRASRAPTATTHPSLRLLFTRSARSRSSSPRAAKSKSLCWCTRYLCSSASSPACSRWRAAPAGGS